jgi:hypothetical protein
VEIDPVTGERSFSGGVTPAGSSYSPGIFHTRGSPNGTARISLSSRNITLTHETGAATLRLDRLEHSLGNGRGRRHRLDAEGNLVFQVGGRIRIDADQPAGSYTGTFEIETSYQ